MAEKQPYIVKECFNYNYDKFYSYKKQIWSDGTIKYFFKGKEIHAKNEKYKRVKNIVNFDKKDSKLTLSYYFPDWFETGVDKKTYQTDYYGKMIEGPIKDIKDPYFSFFKWNKQNKKGISTNVSFDRCVDVVQPLPTKPPQEISNDQGDIILNLPDVVPPTLEPKDATIIISKTGYQDLELNPYTKDGELRDLGPIELKSNKEGLKEAENKSKDISQDQVNKLLKSKSSLISEFIKKIWGFINKIKSVLIPLILKQLMVKLGISNPLDLVEKIKQNPSQAQDIIKDLFSEANPCPPKEVLDQIIQIKNTMVSQLNQTMVFINATTKLLGFTQITTNLLEIAFLILKFLPIPIPPGLPINVPLLIQDNKIFINKLIKKLGSESKGVLNILNILTQTIVQAIDLLNLLDMILEHCYPDTIDSSEQLSSDLISLADTQSSINQNSTITLVNGFTMDIETENTTKPLKRRRAIAKNADGVSLLK